jgi:hypothetical protein
MMGKGRADDDIFLPRVAAEKPVNAANNVMNIFAPSC